MDSVAHGFWYRVCDAIRLYVNIYLNSHPSAVRVQQFRALKASIRSFVDRFPADAVECVIGGDLNFVLSPEQRSSSSAASGWHPGQPVMNAWGDLLCTLGATQAGEIEDYTFRRAGFTRAGDRWWISETLDFARAGFDFLKHAHRQQCTHVVKSLPWPCASDHQAVAVTFARRHHRERRLWQPEVAKAMPDWLMYDARFLVELSTHVTEWAGRRSKDLQGLCEFCDRAQATASTYLQEVHCQAERPDHKLEDALLFIPRLGNSAQSPPARFAHWMRVYPALRELVVADFDMQRSIVFVRGTNALFSLLQELHGEVVRVNAELEAEDTGADGQAAATFGNGVSAGNTLAGSKPHVGVVSSLKGACKASWIQVDRLWDTESNSYVVEVNDMGRCLGRAAAEQQSGPRSDSRYFDRLLRHWDLDLSGTAIDIGVSERHCHVVIYPGASVAGHIRCERTFI